MLNVLLLLPFDDGPFITLAIRCATECAMDVLLLLLLLPPWRCCFEDEYGIFESVGLRLLGEVVPGA